MINNATRDTVQFVAEAVFWRCSVKKVLLKSIKFRATLLKKRLWRRCFPVNFAKFLRTPFLKNTSAFVVRRNAKYKKEENTRIKRKKI